MICLTFASAVVCWSSKVFFFFFFYFDNSSPCWSNDSKQSRERTHLQEHIEGCNRAELVKIDQGRCKCPQKTAICGKGKTHTRYDNIVLVYFKDSGLLARANLWCCSGRVGARCHWEPAGETCSGGTAWRPLQHSLGSAYCNKKNDSVGQTVCTPRLFTNSSKCSPNMWAWQL